MGGPDPRRSARASEKSLAACDALDTGTTRSKETKNLDQSPEGAQERRHGEAPKEVPMRPKEASESILASLARRVSAACDAPEGTTRSRETKDLGQNPEGA